MVLVLAIVAGVSFVRAKRNDEQYQTTLKQFRTTLKPGTSRGQVEEYLRQRGMPFERTCCKPGIFSDRARIGKRPSKFVCSDENIYLEFKFNNDPQQAAVARGSDVLKKIDIVEHGICL